MGKSFVLKGLSGRPGGYVMQVPGALRVKAPGIAGRGARLTALYEDGRAAAFEAEWHDGERALPDEGGRLVGAYLTVGGALTLCTGDAARTAYERDRARERMAALHSPEKKEAPERARMQAQSGAREGAEAQESEKAEEAAEKETEKETEKEAAEKEAAGREEEGETGGAGKIAQKGQENAAGAETNGEGAQNGPATGEEGGRESAGHSPPAGMAHDMPQRRWPPPPCMPAARYVCGRWEG